MFDPATAYLIGSTLSFYLAALVVLFAKCSLNKRSQIIPLNLDHVKYTVIAGAVLVVGVVTKLTVFADVYVVNVPVLLA